MKRKFILSILSIMTVTTLLCIGCANKQKVSSSLKEKNATYQSSNITTDSTSATNTIFPTNKDPKNVTDNDFLKSADEDTAVQLDSVDSPLQELSSDEINTLLNDNTEFKNIPSNFSVK